MCSCAPFRAFVEEREAQAMVEATGSILFFFSCRNQDSDFLYKDFLLNHAQNLGVLSAENGGLFVTFLGINLNGQDKISILCSKRRL